MVRFGSWSGIESKLLVVGQIKDKTVGTAKLMKIGRLQQEETSDHEKNEIESDSISDFLKPVNEIVQKLLREASVHHPSALSELLTVDSSDLIRVFRTLFTKTDDIEETYRQLLNGIEELGAKKFVEQFSDMEVHDSDSLGKEYFQKMDKIIKSMISKPEVLRRMDNSQIRHLYKEYLTQVMERKFFNLIIILFYHQIESSSGSSDDDQVKHSVPAP